MIDPAGDPGATLRALEARGALNVERTTRVGDRSAYRLVSDPIEAEDGEYRFEYVVDGVTYVPLTMRWSMTRGSETIGTIKEFLVYERLPLDAKSRAQLDLDPAVDVGVDGNQRVRQLRAAQRGARVRQRHDGAHRRRGVDAAQRRARRWTSASSSTPTTRCARARTARR